MPNKTIYVKEEDIELFEKAQRLLGDSLSGAIAEGLRRLVVAEEARTRGMGEVVLEVGVWRREAPDVTKIRFIGRLLAEGTELRGETTNGRDRGVDYSLYQTARGNILIHWKKWTCWEEEVDLADYAVFPKLPDAGQELIGTKDSTFVAGPVPASILAQAAEALGQEPVQVLDV